ncbi:MAG: type I-F CRISPR-associated protein Csy1 [Thiothrix lacustris]|uniref:Type I-F CRISPR-associated protein Csy1 n=1 Tax=Thiothrix lacustris TaxID=525917 RepID=A0A1Y1QCP1_9GAMM|nr:MAG: type I-F CRISPR-associated protein Csy1 [Thiothrix lacustris]
MTNPIVDFLEKRKQKPLKEAKKPVAEIEQEFKIAVWGASAANRASQLSLVSHPGKFSHPDARITPVLFTGEYMPDGYVRSGNANAGQDVVGNAAALDVYAFLSVVLDDGRNVLEHFEANSIELKTMLAVDDETFATWRTAFLQIKAVDEGAKTHTNVKQVYFPIADNTEDYHLLSVLYPSGLMNTHRERIRQMKFSDASKAARKARNEQKYHEHGFADLPDVLTQHFGGTKPQNISKLNSNNGGEAWLLSCFPPELDETRPHLPKRDFFRSLRLDKDSRFLLEALRRLLVAGDKNAEITRQKFLPQRDAILEQLFDWVLLKAQQLQNYDAGWSSREGFALPEVQRVWLDQGYFSNRDTVDDWQERIADSITQWVINRHKGNVKKRSPNVVMGDLEVKKFQPLCFERLQQAEALA